MKKYLSILIVLLMFGGKSYKVNKIIETNVNIPISTSIEIPLVDTMNIHIKNRIKNYQVQLKVYPPSGCTYIYCIDIVFKHIQKKREFKIQQKLYANQFSNSYLFECFPEPISFGDTTIYIKLNNSVRENNGIYTLGENAIDFADIDFDGHDELVIRDFSASRLDGNSYSIYKISDSCISEISFKDIGLGDTELGYHTVQINYYNKILIVSERYCLETCYWGYRMNDNGKYYCFWKMMHDRPNYAADSISVSFTNIHRKDVYGLVNKYLYPQLCN